jgi:hypothetical protein
LVGGCCVWVLMYGCGRVGGWVVGEASKASRILLSSATLFSVCGRNRNCLVLFLRKR